MDQHLPQHWLCLFSHFSLLSIPDFVLFRDDRSGKKGGGTCIYTRDSLNASVISRPSYFPYEIDVSIVTVSGTLLMCIYIPPSASSEVLQMTHDACCLAVDCLPVSWPKIENCIIAGDFNHFDTRKLCSELLLVDIVSKPTRGDNILDHILISHDLKSVYTDSNVSYDSPISTSDHLTISATPSVDLSEGTNAQRVSCVFDYRQSHLKNLYSRVAQVDWSELSVEEDVNKQCEIFQCCIQEAITETIPLNYVTLSNQEKSWMTPLGKHMINEKWHAFRCRNWPVYHHLKQKLRNEIYKAKMSWAGKTKASSKNLWSFVNSIVSKKTNVSIDNLLRNYSSVDKFFEELKNALLAVSTSNNAHLNLDYGTSRNGWNPVIAEREVYVQLSKLNKHKSTGSDLVPNRIYSCLADLIADPLSHIFRSSLKLGIFPDAWKYGIIKPIPKSSPVKIDALRPITLLPTPSKIFERLVFNSLLPLFISSYGTTQYGFRPKSSTTTAIIKLMDSATSFFDDKDLFGAAILSFDLSKAFDNIEHARLLEKMQRLQFPPLFVTWLRSYLTNRTCALKIHHTTSQPFPVTRGVPQGSVLGPPLFCCFVSDLVAQGTSTTTIKYADDTTLILPLSRSSILSEPINSEVRHVKQWCDDNSLRLNLTKSKAILITRSPLTQALCLEIPTCDQMSLLGVVIDDRLSWSSHVTKVMSKCSKRFYALKKVRPYLSPEDLHTVYETSIRSIIEYACPAFVGLSSSLEQLLQRIDRRAHRIIDSKGRSASNCFCVPLQTRRKQISVKLFSQCEKEEDHLLHHLIPERLPYTRSIRIPYSRTNLRRCSFLPFISALMNDLRL